MKNLQNTRHSVLIIYKSYATYVLSVTRGKWRPSHHLSVHRQNVKVTNAKSTKRRKTKRRMGQNVEWKKRRMVQNVEWKKLRMGQKVE
jgi:hypothetical protein